MNVREIEKNDLVLFGLLGIEDILREEVPRAIQQCNNFSFLSFKKYLSFAFC